MKIWQILFCILLGALSCAGDSSNDSAASPDVFLITIDTLRADHIHCYGYEKIQTPTLDRLAEEGIRFTNAFTPSPITNTSHVTIMTGLLPGNHGVKDFGVMLNPKHVTLAELLKRLGYQTGAFIGSVILDSRSLSPGLNRGFDFYDNFSSPAVGKSRWGRVERRGFDVVQRAEAWLDAHQSGAPRFVWVHLYDPHDPYEPPAPYAQLYRDHSYDGEIAYADAALGNLIAYLRKRGRYQQSLVVVTGDHGEGLGEHGEQTHGIFLYDSTTRVPLLVKLPEMRMQGRTLAAQVRTTDILPTVLDILGVTNDASLDGRSLKPYIDGTETDGRPLLGETNYPMNFGWAPLRSVREDDTKFIEAPRPEFYDLKTDPHETKSLYEPWNPAVQKMRGELKTLGTLAAGTAANAGTVSKQTSDELRALGYLHQRDDLTSSSVAEPSLLPDPKDKIIEFNLIHSALLDVDSARFAEARVKLKEVLRADPQSSFALGQLADIELKTGKFLESAQDWSHASELQPGNSGILFNYGKALKSAGDDRGAESALIGSLKIDPNQYGARLLLSEVDVHLRDFDDARDQLEAATLIHPTFDANRRLAEVLLDEQRYADALQLLQSLIKQRPNDAHLYDLLATAYSGLKQAKDAETARNRAASLRVGSKNN